MACEETDPSCHYVPQISQPFVWTEDAHSLYLSFLEDAFVSDLYHRHYCSRDICGYSPPFSAHTPPSSTAAQGPSSALPQPPTMPQPSQPKSIAEPKSCRKRSRSGSKASSTKRKGKWLPQDTGLDNQLVFEPSIGPDKNLSSLEQPGSSLQPFESYEGLIPKGPRWGLKRPRVKGLDEKLRGRGTDQVVPSVF